MGRLLGSLAVIVVICGLASSVQAAMITFGAASNISGVTDVTLGGQTTLDRAYGFGVGSMTINGVSFTDFAAQGSDTKSGLGGSFGGYGTAGQIGDYATLLTSGIWQDGGSTSITFNNLHSGAAYSIGVWVNDNRQGIPARILTLSGDTGGVTGSLKYGGGSGVQSGQFAYGTFTADTNGQQVLNLDLAPGSTENNQINGVVLAYSPVPEPSTVAMLITVLLGLAAGGWRKRK